MKASARLVFAVVMVCLFCSGVAGLVYEVVWARYLALFLGHTSYAVVAVLVAFMGGLALGNAVIGARADRAERPLAFYGWLELGIGLYALVFPFYYQLCHQGFVAVARHAQPGGVVVLGLKFAFSLLTILAPTVLMGGTLPLLTRLVSRSLGELREKVAALYFVNSAGAVVGTWLADFVLLDAFGLEGGIYVGAALNLGVGALALVVSNAWKEGESPAVVATETRGAGQPEVFSPSELRLAVAGITLSGFVAMLYQVAWTRLLALVLGSSTHAFAVMLITFISGITVGSALVYRWRRLGNSLVAFAWSELALAGTLAGSMFLYHFLPYWFAVLSSLLARRPESYPLYHLLQGVICFGVMFVPTVCLGMTLPLVSRVATAELGRAGRSVGRVFAVNTLGTVLGAGLTGLVLLPRLGLARTFALGIGLNAVIGLAVLWRGQWRARRAWLAFGPVALAGLVLVAGLCFDRLWQGVLTLGLWRQTQLPATAGQFTSWARAANLAYYRDGAGATVSVLADVRPNRDLFLKVNGKTEASTTTDMNTQLMVGHLPMLLHPNPREALLIGLGSGITAGALTAHPSLERLDCAEISPEVAAAAALFAAANRRVLEEPRMHLIIEDAKSFLQLTGRRYDVIVSEPSNPWMAGVAGVFTLEFYGHCRAHLAKDGLMVQWVQLYEFSDAGLDIVVRTFGEVFPHFSIWQSHWADLFLIGSVTPGRVDLETFARRLAAPAVKADLARVDMANVPLVLSQEILASDNAPFLAPPETPLHGDFFPVLEYVAQRDFFARPMVDRFRQLDENFSRRPATLLGEWVAAHPPTMDDYLAFARYHLAGRSKYVDLLATVLLRWHQESPAAPEPLELGTRFQFLSAPGELEVLRLSPQRPLIIQRARQQPVLLRQYGTALMRAYREQRSLFFAPPTKELEEVLPLLVETDPDNQRVYQGYQAELAWDRGDDEGCLKTADRALAADVQRGAASFKLDPAEPLRVAPRVADILLRRRRPAEAVALCDAALQAGYVTEKTRYDALLFEVTHRKARARLPHTGPRPGGAR